jgi:predicted glycoside hydrolase/deacetylase ChbG (UPF0249 family)/glycosyltransferase involved in cell wall biosynthesis
MQNKELYNILDSGVIQRNGLQQDHSGMVSEIDPPATELEHSLNAAAPASDNPLRILSLSGEYPNPREPGKALFIQARLQAISKVADVSVVAPVALLDYANPQGNLLGSRGIPFLRTDDRIEVFHPRWIYPPRGGALNAVCLYIRLLPLVYRLKKRRQFDVIDAHFLHPEGIAAALLGATFKLPFVVTMRGSEFLHRRYRVRRRWMSWAVKRAALAITVSEGLRDLAVQLGARQENTTVIPNGINSETFHQYDREASRRHYQIETNTRLILTAGNLAPIKCHENIVKALRGVIDSGIKAQLWIAGGTGRSGRHEAVIRAEVKANDLEDHVRFVGELPQKELATMMAAADVFCLASSREGWPNVVNEALACGTPVVATDVGAVRRMITSPDHGMVVPSGDVPALERSLVEALTRTWDRETISAAASSRSWSQVAKEATGSIATKTKTIASRRIIINADDFGMSEHVNHAICDAMLKRKITSVTILANAPFIEQALRQVRYFADFSFGVHLNLTEFEPLTGGPGARLLTDQTGHMTRQISNMVATPPLMEAIYEEWSAQITRLISAGVEISHIDSHNHIHTVPFVFPALKAIQKRFGIRKVRITKNIYSADQPCAPGLKIKKVGYNFALRRFYRTDTTDGFSELATYCKEAHVHSLRHRSVELMVHPGAPNNEAETELLYSDWRGGLGFPIAQINYNQL